MTSELLKTLEAVLLPSKMEKKSFFFDIREHVFHKSALRITLREIANGPRHTEGEPVNIVMRHVFLTYHPQALFEVLLEDELQPALSVVLF